MSDLRPSWDRVRSHSEKEIEKARDRLETRGLSEADTEFERGRIKALREVLALADPPKPIPPSGPGYG